MPTRIKGIKGSPFGQTSIRFHERNKSLPGNFDSESNGPYCIIVKLVFKSYNFQTGPGSYNVPDEVSSVIRKNM